MPGGNNGDGKGNQYSPLLVIPYQVGDTGARPLPPGTVFWESPNVWTIGSMGKNQPVVGEPTQVWAMISNLGSAPANPLTIKYYWADPSMAIIEDPTKLIGELTGQYLDAGNTLPFQCPSDWMPKEVNNGHECIVVEAFVLVYDPLTDPMQPTYDRHVGQKNEQLLLLQAGQQFHFQLSAQNITRAEQEIAIEVRPGLIPRNFAKRFGTPDMWRTELLDPSLSLPVELHIADKALQRAPYAEHAARRLIHSERSHDIACLGPPQTSKTHLFNAGEVRHVTVTGQLPRGTRMGEVYVLRINQRIGNTVTGGYTLYLTLAAPKA